MNKRRKQLREIERYKLLEELKETKEKDYYMSSKAFYAIQWAIEYLESEEQNND